MFLIFACLLKKETITSNKQSPKEDWLSFVKTSRARSKIKNSLNEEKKKIGQEGKELLLRKLRHIKINFNHKTENEMIKFFNLMNSLDMYFLFGTGKLNNKHIRSFVNTKNQGLYGLLKRKISSKENKNNNVHETVKKVNSQPIILFHLRIFCKPRDWFS